MDPKTPLEAADERSFEVRTGASMVTLEASKRDLASVKAVLVINGKITDPNEMQDSFREIKKNEEMLPLVKSFGDQPGLIVKVRPRRVMRAVRASHARRSQLSGASLPRRRWRPLQHFMFAMWGDKNVGGGCYFFESLADIETYLSSDFWETVSSPDSTPWFDVTYEAFEIGV